MSGKNELEAFADALQMTGGESYFRRSARIDSRRLFIPCLPPPCHAWRGYRPSACVGINPGSVQHPGCGIGFGTEPAELNPRPDGAIEILIYGQDEELVSASAL